MPLGIPALGAAPGSHGARGAWPAPRGAPARPLLATQSPAAGPRAPSEAPEGTLPAAPAEPERRGACWPVRAGLAALLLGLALLVPAACGEEPPPRPNVVLFVVDTLRKESLSCYGHPRLTSPWLDSLAAEGTLFEDVTAQAPWTLPSMVSMFTGRYLTAYREKLPEDAADLAELFRAAGYRTVGVVANLSVNDLAGFHRGFDVYDLQREEPHPGDTGDRPRTAERLSDDLWKALAREEELSAGRDAPLFLFVFPYDPHDPYYPHADLDGALPPQDAVPVQPPGWQRERLADHPATPPAADPDWSKHLAHIEKQRGFYDQEVRHTDRMLAEVMEGLRARGLLDHAIVAFASDHGEGLWEHVAHRAPEELAEATPLELFYKTHGAHLYEEAVATPLVLWGAGVPAGLRVAAPVENVDLAPTLLDLAGIPTPDTFHGRSLRPLLEGTATWRPTVHSFVHDQASVREAASGLKLIQPLGAAGRALPSLQLYHLPSDPHERHDLAAERPDDVARLQAALAAWRERYPDEAAERDPAQLEILRALGYTAEDIGQ